PELMTQQERSSKTAAHGGHSALAESTSGRRAANDAKLTARLRNGGRLTTDPFDRIRGFMENNRPASARPAVIERARAPRPAAAPMAPAPASQRDPQRHFRLFHTPQKHPLFRSTRSGK